MKNTALLFPGQGSQFIGMGLELFNSSKIARSVFEEVDDALNFKLSSLMQKGDIEELTMTVNAQPAIMAVSIAALRVLYNNLNISSVDKISDFVAGHSLGEYSALCGVGAFNLSETSKLLKIRGNAMQNAVPYGKGGMLALLNSAETSVSALCKNASQIGVCEVANDNGAGQFVLSGDINAIDHAEKVCKDFDIKKAIKLNVSAPFHSSMMKPAADAMQEALNSLQVGQLCVPVIANFTAEPNIDSGNVTSLLVNQVCGKVRWRESIDFLYNNGINRFVEVGPGKVLTTLAKRMYPECEIYNLSTPESIDDYCAVI